MSFIDLLSPQIIFMQQPNYQDEAMISDEMLYELKHKDYKEKPYCSLVPITSVPFNADKNRLNYGTGAFISPNLILTAAHNLYDYKQKQPYQHVKYLLSPHGQVFKKIFKDINKSMYDRVPLKYDETDLIKHDFALICTKEQYSYDICMKLTICCPKACTFTNRKQSLQIYGYPYVPYVENCSNYKDLDKEGKKILLNQWGSKRQDRIAEITYQALKIRYHLSTLPGQSGTAVMYANKFVAIHKAGSNKKDYNFGRLITVDMVEKLIEWTSQLGGKAFQINTENVCECLSEKVKQLTQKLRTINVKKDIRINKPNMNLLNIQLSQYQHLKQLNLKMNKLKAIDLSHSPILQELCLSSNELEIIDLSKNTELIHLYLSQNQITALNIANNAKLTKLYLDDNKLVDLDLSKNQLLVQLSFSYNKTKTIDLSNNPQLLRLSLSSNDLTNIDLSKNPNIISLFLDENKLNSVILPNSPNLKQLKLNDNRLKHIDLTAYTKLVVLSLCNNCLDDAIFWFQISMQWRSQSIFNLYNQNSQNCKVTILYKKEHEQECEAFLAEGIKGFQIKGLFHRYILFYKAAQDCFQNKYNCNYKFQMRSKI